MILKKDKLTNFLNELTNAVLFSCYEEDTVDIKRLSFLYSWYNTQSRRVKFLIYKFSKNYKINENIFKK